MNCPHCGQNNPSGKATCSACGVSLQAASVAGAAPHLPVGTNLQGGRFTVGKVLGEGGFGITYKGSDPVLRRQVAIKELFPPGCTRQNNSIVPRLTAQDFNQVKNKSLEEARTVASFNHSGIVKVYECFEENNTAYMVMEYLNGETLDAVLQRGAVSEQKGVGYVKVVGEALAAVHERGVLHRDIKPANIMVTGDDRVVLIDFGAAREFTARRSGDMTMVLTPGYAPLEQYAERGRFDRYTDVYALGATLYHLLTGGVPVSAADRANGIELREPRQVNNMVSQTVNDAVMIAMAQSAPERFQSAGEFLDALMNPAPYPVSGKKSSSPDRQAFSFRLGRMRMSKCRACGVNVPDTSQPCPECGSLNEDPASGLDNIVSLPESPEPSDVGVAAENTGGARLTLLRAGQDTGIVYEGLGSGSVVGRFDPDTGPIEVDLAQLPESGYVSRRHAEIILQSSGQWSIRDLGSTNGTFVKRSDGNFERITNDHELQSGDLVAFGNVQFRFEV